MGSSWVVRHRNALLLAMLLLAYTFQSFAISTQTRGLVLNFALVALEFAMIYVVFDRPHERLLFAVVLVAATVLGLSRYVAFFDAQDGRALVFYLLHAIFLWASVIVI